MNKQQALEAVVGRVLDWEESGREVRLTPAEDVFGELLEAARGIDMLLRQPASRAMESAVAERLTVVGAAAVYLLTNEVTVVEGRTLDEWLASTEDQRLAMFARGETRLVVEHSRPAPSRLQGDEHEEAIG